MDFDDTDHDIADDDNDNDNDNDDEEDEEEHLNLSNATPAPPQSFVDSVVPQPSSTRPRLAAAQLGLRKPGGGGTPSTKYKECLKNHAVSLGGHATDGCGEFLPAGEDGTLDALKCAACNCHRNFHRKETDVIIGGAAAAPSSAAGTAMYHHHHHVPAGPPYYRTPPSAPPYLQAVGSGGGTAGMMMMMGPSGSHYRPLALPSPSGVTHSRDEMEDVSNPSSSGGGGGGGGGIGSSSGKKRFRTKFTQEQKEKMFAFAEKVGWRIQKQDEAAVEQFCQEAQVKRQVLKVWMHNNKHTLGKRNQNLNQHQHQQQEQP